MNKNSIIRNVSSIVLLGMILGLIFGLLSLLNEMNEDYDDIKNHYNTQIESSVIIIPGTNLICNEPTIIIDDNQTIYYCNIDNVTSIYAAHQPLIDYNIS